MDDSTLTKVHKLLDDGYVLFARTVDGQFVVVMSPACGGPVNFTGTGNDLGEALERAIVHEKRYYEMQAEHCAAASALPNLSILRTVQV